MEVVGISGGMSKFDGKTGISRGVNGKEWKIPEFKEGHDKINWKSRGYNFFLEKSKSSDHVMS